MSCSVSWNNREERAAHVTSRRLEFGVWSAMSSGSAGPRRNGSCPSLCIMPLSHESVELTACLGLAEGPRTLCPGLNGQRKSRADGGAITAAVFFLFCGFLRHDDSPVTEQAERLRLLFVLCVRSTRSWNVRSRPLGVGLDMKLSNGLLDLLCGLHLSTSPFNRDRNLSIP